MLKEVAAFVMEACKRTHIPLSLNFYPSVYQQDKFDIYSINLNGRPVINFTDKNFHDIPKSKRFQEFVPLIKVGLTHNLGEESLKETMEIPRRMGMQVIRRGILLKPELLNI